MIVVLTIVILALVVSAFLGLGAVVSAMTWIIVGGLFVAMLRLR